MTFPDIPAVLSLIRRRELSEKNQYNLPPIFCKIGVFYTVLCMVSSVMTLSAISCDRFLAVICPLRTRVTQRKAR